MIPTAPLAPLVLAAALIGAQAAAAIAQPAQDANPVAAESDVPMFRGDPAHTGAHPGPGPAGDPVVRWRVDLGGLVLGSPAVVDRIVYVGSTAEPPAGPTEDNASCVLHAIDAAIGAERWRVETGPVFSSPAVVGGVVYVANTDGVLFAVGGTAGA